MENILKIDSTELENILHKQFSNIPHSIKLAFIEVANLFGIL